MTTVASDNKFPKLIGVEQGSDPATPSSGERKLFAKADGWYDVDDAGTVTGPLAPAQGVTVDDETGTTYTVLVGDDGLVKRFTNASAVTVTLPDGIATGTIVELLAWGAGGVTVQGNGTSTVQQTGSIAQYEAVSCLVVATDTWSVVGPLT